ncbi:MAG: hypothetical protein AAFX87_24475 [Bacteroidota bacterium]
MLRISLFILILITLGGCKVASIQAPKNKVPVRKDIGTDAFGGWITLNRVHMGELIAVSEDTVYLFQFNQLNSFPKADVKYAELVIHRNSADDYGTWASLGSFLTISNGYFALFTLPTWIISGLTVTKAERKRENFLIYPAQNWEEISKFSRFPQGLPASLDRKLLKGRAVK